MDMGESEKSIKKAMKIASGASGKTSLLTSFANNLQSKLGHFTCENVLVTLFTRVQV